MKYIKRKSAVKPISGQIVDTLNVADYRTNAPSLQLTNDLLAPVDSIIAFDNDEAEIPEGYEEVENPDLENSYTVLLNTSTTSIATLSDDISKYKRLKIFCATADGHRTFVEVYNNNSNEVISSIFAGSCTSTSYGYYKNARIIINGTSLTIDRQYSMEFTFPSKVVATAQNTAIAITRIEGYNY